MCGFLVGFLHPRKVTCSHIASWPRFFLAGCYAREGGPPSAHQSLEAFGPQFGQKV